MRRNDRLEFSVEPALSVIRAGFAAVRRRAFDEWAGTAAYRMTLESPRATGVAAGPRDFRATDREAGRKLMAGRFELAGAALEIAPGSDPWDRPSPSRLFAVRLHRFDWIADLMGVGEAGAREVLRLLLGWRGVFERPTAFAWGPETLERRVYNLACAVRGLGAVASEAEIRVLSALLAVQARHLLRLKAGPLRAAERACASAIAGAALAGPVGTKILSESLPALSRALAAGVLPDGGMRSRSPQAGLELLLDLMTLDDVLLQRGREAPVEVARAIDRLAAALRFFVLGDRRLPSFQGGEAGDPSHLDAARAYEAPESKPFGYAPHSGYQRVEGKTLQVMVDAAPPAEGLWSLTACAHPLAVEVVAGRDRLIVNPGWSPDAAAPQALRLTAAASTASLGEASAGRPLVGLAARLLGARLVGGARRVDARRNESDGGVWIEMAHDGWRRAFGHIHERRLFVDIAADEMRGEDRFKPAGDVPKGEVQDVPFAVRFHLHPDVQVSLARDQRSVLLKGPSERGWWFRNDAPEVTLEPSVWFEHGLPRRTAQVVLRGRVARIGGGRVRWKLTPMDPAQPIKR